MWVDLDAEVFLCLKQHRQAHYDSTPFVGKHGVREQLLKHRKRTTLGQCMLVLTFFNSLKCAIRGYAFFLQNPEKHMNEILPYCSMVVLSPIQCNPVTHHRCCMPSEATSYHTTGGKEGRKGERERHFQLNHTICVLVEAFILMKRPIPQPFGADFMLHHAGTCWARW